MSDADELNPTPPSHDLAPRPLSILGIICTVVVIAVVAVGLVFWVRHHAKESQAKAMGGGRGHFGQGGMPMPVVGAKAVVGDIPITVDALGTVTPLATVTVRAQIGGVLMQIAFTEGQTVAKGAFLAQIDDRPYQAALAQAKGSLERDQALLKDAKIDLDRYALLVKSDSISRQQYDTQAALVQQDEGAVATDRAAIDAADINITYCRIVAPVAGRVGIRQVDQGNLVQPSDANGLVVITEMDPISVIYTVPEDRLPQINRRLLQGATLPVTSFDRNEGSVLAEGTLVAEDNLIDTSTGTVKMRAEFANGNGALFPNQFVNVRMLVDTLTNATVVPAAAIQQGAPGSYVYLIQKGEQGDTVTVRPVKLGPATEESVAVTDGLNPGDEVVTQGADRLKDGAKVDVTEGTSASSGTPTHHHAHGQGGHHGHGTASGGWVAGGGGGGDGASHWNSGGAASASEGWVNGGADGEPASGTQAPHHRHHHPSDDQGQGQ